MYLNPKDTCRASQNLANATCSVSDTVNLPAVARPKGRSAMRERGVPSSRYLNFDFEMLFGATLNAD
jgi:hypothetical protein